MNPDAALNRLIIAWEQWDLRSGSDTAAAAMVDACRQYTGGGCVEFRRHLQSAYRSGMSRGDAIKTWDSEW